MLLEYIICQDTLEHVAYHEDVARKVQLNYICYCNSFLRLALKYDTEFACSNQGKPCSYIRKLSLRTLEYIILSAYYRG